MPGYKSIGKRKQLLVEGDDDERLFGALLSHLGLAEAVQTQNFRGKDQLGGFLKALCRDPEFRNVVSMGIIRDANADPRSAFQSVQGALQRAGLPVPDGPMVLEGDTLKVATLIVPDPDTPGMLEDLCMRSVAGDPTMECVEEFLECVARKGAQPGNMSKARTYAHLASRARPGLRIGEAAEAGYWPWDSPAFTQVRRFLSGL